MRGGRAAMAKLESRIRELEIEPGNVQDHTSESAKGHQKAERKIKELAFQNDEDRKNQDRMSDLATSCRPRSRHTRSRLRRLRKLPPSTLPNSARPSRSSRRLRREPEWLRVTSPPSGTRSASHDTQAEKDDDDHCIDLKLETAYTMLIYAS